MALRQGRLSIWLHSMYPVISRGCLLALASLTAVLGFEVASYAQRPPVRQAKARTTTNSSSEASPAALQPGDVSLDHSRVLIHVFKTGLGHEHAVEGKLASGTIHFGAETNAGQLVFDMQSLDADTPLARKFLKLEGETSDSVRAQVNDNMHGKKVLNTAEFPQATFDITSAMQQHDRPSKVGTAYTLDGNFTLHGVTRPLKIDAVVDRQEHGFQHVRCRFSIRQTDYGMKPYTAALGAVGVADELEILGDAWVKAETPQIPAAASTERAR